MCTEKKWPWLGVMMLVAVVMIAMVAVRKKSR